VLRTLPAMKGQHAIDVVNPHNLDVRRGEGMVTEP
jgi:hypothetical protein